MKLTPLDIHHKEFRRSIRGYNEEEVDAFLDDVAEEFERVFKENIDVKEQFDKLRDKLNQYENLEETLQKTLVTAQKSAEEVQVNARKEGELTVRDAELKAKEMIQQALQKKKQVDDQIAQLRQLEEDYRLQLRTLSESVMSRAAGRIDVGQDVEEEAPDAAAHEPEVDLRQMSQPVISEAEDNEPLEQEIDGSGAPSSEMSDAASLVGLNEAQEAVFSAAPAESPEEIEPAESMSRLAEPVPAESTPSETAATPEELTPVETAVSEAPPTEDARQPEDPSSEADEPELTLDWGGQASEEADSEADSGIVPGAETESVAATEDVGDTDAPAETSLDVPSEAEVETEGLPGWLKPEVEEVDPERETLLADLGGIDGIESPAGETDKGGGPLPNAIPVLNGTDFEISPDLLPVSQATEEPDPSLEWGAADGQTDSGGGATRSESSDGAIPAEDDLGEPDIPAWLKEHMSERAVADSTENGLEVPSASDVLESPAPEPKAEDPDIEEIS